MLLERERAGGTGDTPPHTLLSSIGADGGKNVGNKERERKTEIEICRISWYFLGVCEKQEKKMRKQTETKGN